MAKHNAHSFLALPLRQRGRSLRETTLGRALRTSLFCKVLALALLLSSSVNARTPPPPAPNTQAAPAPAPTLTWTLEAALAAERAAAYNCSGNGDVFVDTLSFVDPSAQVLCECYECFRGPDCAERVNNCTVRFTGGDLALLYPYWKQYNKNQSVIIVPGYYRPSYGVVQDNSSFRFIPPLEEEIKKLHSTTVKNAVTKDRYIVMGVGSIQLVNAAIWSYAQDNVGTYRNDVVASAPYYFLFRDQTLQFENMKYRWYGDANNWTNSTNTSAIEIITDPTNPIGNASGPPVETESLIYDYAYYWPHFTAMREKPMDNDVMLFSMTKSLGFAGTRIGWAIVKNKTIYDRMTNYVSNNIIGISHESQLRAFQLLRMVNQAYSRNVSPQVTSNNTLLSKEEYGEKGLVFHYAYLELQERWVRLSEVFNGTNRFVLQHLEYEHCYFFNKTHAPSPAFAWIRCTYDTEVDNCAKVFADARIIVRPGSLFDSTDDYVRLSLMTRIASFDTMINYLKDLVMNS